MPALSTSPHLPTSSKPDEPSPLLNLAVYPPTVCSLLTWTLTLPRVSIPSEWAQKSARWREEQIWAMREEQWRYRQRWLVTVCAAQSSQTWALAPVGGTTVQGRPKQLVRFKTPSAHATFTEPNAFSAHVSLRTANATLGPLTGPRYFVRLKESWRQLIEHVRHHKSPELSSRHNNSNASSNLPTVTQQSMEKKGRKFLQQHECEEDEGDDETGGEQAHQQQLKRARRCKGE